MKNTDPTHLLAILQNSLIYKSLNPESIDQIAERTEIINVQKGARIFRDMEACDFFFIVIKGLVKVYVSSSNGTRMTYLLAKQGEPLNIIAPFIQKTRPIVAQALKKSTLARLSKADFLAIVYQYPKVVSNIVDILGRAIDSSNSRIIDMVEKKVDERLFRALFSLYRKFGTPLNFTSPELANIVGTTTESVLRAMGRLKRQGILTSTRGRIDIVNSSALEKYGIESLWI